MLVTRESVRNDGAWRQALSKARKVRPFYSSFKGTSCEHCVTTWFEVEGSTGRRYTVEVHTDKVGTHVTCDCEAGRQDRPCYHTARVLDHHREYHERLIKKEAR